MTNELAIQNNFTAEKIALIKNTVAKDATDIELQFFVEQCKRTGLDPVTRQIYFIKDKQGKVNVQTSIDGLRLIAARSDEYEGQTPAQWCGQDGVWKDVWLDKKPPAACKVGVYKKQFREALYAVALFDEYAQKTRDYKTGEEKLNYIWGSKPSLMLAKVAEALALRKAFPNDMSGIYTVDEYTPETNETREIKEIKSVTPKVITPQVVEQQPQTQEPDQPQELVQGQTDPNYVCEFGQYKGRRIGEIKNDELVNYVKNYLFTQREKTGNPFPIYVENFVKAAGFPVT